MTPDMKHKQDKKTKKKRCPNGTRRNKAGVCVPKGQNAKPKKECPPGKVLNPKTNRCNKIKTPKKPKKPKKPEKPEKPKTLKPCPEGQERNLKTNRCRKIQKKKGSPPMEPPKPKPKPKPKPNPKKVSPKPKPAAKYFAKFYDISNEVDPEYDNNGHLREEMDTQKRIETIINKHPELKQGDVLFVGSSNETRQEYGFAIYLPENKNAIYESGQDGVSEPLEIVRRWIWRKGEKGANPLEHVRYSKLINDFMEEEPPKGYDSEIVGLFMGDDWRDEEELEELVDDYKKEGLWD